MPQPIWFEDVQRPDFAPLNADHRVDVVVIGGGLTGATAAYLLKKAGVKVALIEKARCGDGDTGHTTAHLTYQTDERLSKLVGSFGRARAEAAWDAGLAAMHQIHQNVRLEHLDCDFQWVPGYFHASLTGDDKDERAKLKQDAELAADFGFPATYLENIPLVQRPGMRLADQAMFHPLKYLSGLLQRIAGDGSFIFENTEAHEVTDKPLAIRAGKHRLTCGHVVIATHVPLTGKNSLLSASLLQTKLAPYTSYAVGAKLPLGDISTALYWDTSDPYYYLRIERLEKNIYAILGGEDHKTGQVEDGEDRWRRLEQKLGELFPQCQPASRWSGQVIETNDGLPYIGETAPGQFVATGFSGNGMTFGTLAGMLARDWVLGRTNPWSDLFSVNRKNLLGGTWDYIKENLDYPFYMLKDRLSSPEAESIDSVGPGEGKLVQVGGRRLAVYCDEEGQTTCLSPVCTHMGCIVHWNQAESTWDCPCHGSRFHATGEVLAGPAETPLEKKIHRAIAVTQS